MNCTHLCLPSRIGAGRMVWQQSNLLIIKETASWAKSALLAVTRDFMKVVHSELEVAGNYTRMEYRVLRKYLGSLGITVKKGKVWEYWAGFARPILPFFFLTTAIPTEPILAPGFCNPCIFRLKELIYSCKKQYNCRRIVIIIFSVQEVFVWHQRRNRELSGS
jgi:hypothetical protein